MYMGWVGFWLGSKLQIYYPNQILIGFIKIKSIHPQESN